MYDNFLLLMMIFTSNPKGDTSINFEVKISPYFIRSKRLKNGVEEAKIIQPN